MRRVALIVVPFCLLLVASEFLPRARVRGGHWTTSPLLRGYYGLPDPKSAMCLRPRIMATE